MPCAAVSAGGRARAGRSRSARATAASSGDRLALGIGGGLLRRVAGEKHRAIGLDRDPGVMHGIAGRFPPPGGLEARSPPGWGVKRPTRRSQRADGTFPFWWSGNVPRYFSVALLGTFPPLKKSRATAREPRAGVLQLSARKRSRAAQTRVPIGTFPHAVPPYPLAHDHDPVRPPSRRPRAPAAALRAQRRHRGERRRSAGARPR